MKDITVRSNFDNNVQLAHVDGKNILFEYAERIIYALWQITSPIFKIILKKGI